MGHKFSLVLSREITDGESEALKEAGCTEATFGTDSHPTNPDLTVTKMDFDDANSPSLAEAIESALEAVKKVPDISVPGLTVPAQPVETPDGELEAAAKPDAAAEEETSGVEADAENSNADAASPEPATEPVAHG